MPAAAARPECRARSATPAMELIRRRCRPASLKMIAHDPKALDLPPAVTRQKITFGEMRASGVRGLLIYCSDYKRSHSTAPFVNCFTYAERGLIYQAPVCNGHWRSQNGCYFEFSFPRNRTECRLRNGPNRHHRLRNRIAPFVTLPSSWLKFVV